MTCLASPIRAFSLLMLGACLLGGCLPSPQSQSDEEKEYHYLAGKNRINSMDYKGAIEAFEKALVANPHSAAAHFELGWLFDQKESDPAAAIYHYGQYLKLRPDADNTEMVKTRILACKQELARTVSLGPVTQTLQREFEQMAESNRQLKEQVEKWQAAYQALAAQVRAEAQRPAPAAAEQARSAPGGATATQSGVIVAVMTNPNQPPVHTAQPPASATRTHTVKAGETLTAIARKYGVKVDALTAANPGLQPRRMPVGLVLKIPSS